MLQRYLYLLFIFLTDMAWGQVSDPLKFEQMSLSELEEYHLNIQTELEGLAKKSFNHKSGSIGYFTPFTKEISKTEWIEIDLGKETDIQEVVLIPSIKNDQHKGYIADGFPEALEIQAYSPDEDSYETVAVYKSEPSGFIDVYPMIFPVTGVNSSRIRVVAKRLGKSQLSSIEPNMTFQLAEIMIFSGDENVALRRPVNVLSPSFNGINWRKEFLVDGNLPYLLDAASGERSLSMSAFVRKESNESITIDLGKEIPVSRLRIHTEDLSSTVPQTYLHNNGMPVKFTLEGSKESDFQETDLLLEVFLESSAEVGPIMEWFFKEKAYRYIRLTSLEHSHSVAGSNYPPRIGLSEIEILSEGRNVALGKSVAATFPVKHKKANLVNLTDGRNLYGDILPQREWIKQLSKRSMLEKELPIVLSELYKRYASQKKVLTWTGVLAGLLVLGWGGLFYNGRRLRKLNEAKIRDRIAANLHDELGANLHAIGLLGDLAKDSVDHREDLVDTVERIRELTKITGESAYRCANMLEAEGSGNDLITQMQADNKRFLCDLEYKFNSHGEAYLKTLSDRVRTDILLFYKESLVNIIRHSEATFVNVSIFADAEEIRLIIEDNGSGLGSINPKALARRARLLGAEFKVNAPDLGQGTVIKLTKKQQRWNFFFKMRVKF